MGSVAVRGVARIVLGGTAQSFGLSLVKVKTSRITRIKESKAICKLWLFRLHRIDLTFMRGLQRCDCCYDDFTHPIIWQRVSCSLTVNVVESLLDELICFTVLFSRCFWSLEGGVASP